jgi:hypothetical protein
MLISLSLILVGLERIKEWQCSFPYLDSVFNVYQNIIQIAYYFVIFVLILMGLLEKDATN